MHACYGHALRADVGEERTFAPPNLNTQSWAKKTDAELSMENMIKQAMSTPPTTPPSGPGVAGKRHPAWIKLTELGSTNLAWRRAACQDSLACAISELARGGVLQILQRSGLAVPPNTKGAINAYVTAKQTDELGRAVQAYLATTTDPFYSTCPKENINYGGKGAGQQLWWSNKAKGWRVTQPNRHMMAQISGAPAPAPRRTASKARPRANGEERPKTKTKRRRLPQMPTIKREEKSNSTGPIPISDEDICLLPIFVEDELAMFGSKQITHHHQVRHHQQTGQQQPLSDPVDFSYDSDDSAWSVEESMPFSLGCASDMLFDPLCRVGSETPEVAEEGHDVLLNDHRSFFVEDNSNDYDQADVLNTPWTIEEDYGVSHEVY